MKAMFAVVIPLLVVTGCGPAGTDPSPAPSVSSTAVPRPTPSPSAQSSDELYAEAERVLLEAIEVINRHEVAGEYSGMAEELTPFAMGDFLASTLAAYSLLEEKQWHGKASEVPTITVEPAPGVTYQDSEVALHVCQDSTNAPLYGPDGSVASIGRILESRYYFKRDSDAKLKVFYQQYREVESCILGS